MNGTNRRSARRSNPVAPGRLWRSTSNPAIGRSIRTKQPRAAAWKPEGPMPKSGSSASAAVPSAASARCAVAAATAAGFHADAIHTGNAPAASRKRTLDPRPGRGITLACGFVPQGLSDNSPPIHGWVNDALRCEVPSGRLRRVTALRVRTAGRSPHRTFHSSLRDFEHERGRGPSDESLGNLHVSPRDKIARRVFQYGGHGPITSVSAACAAGPETPSRKHSRGTTLPSLRAQAGGWPSPVRCIPRVSFALAKRAHDHNCRHE